MRVYTEAYTDTATAVKSETKSTIAQVYCQLPPHQGTSADRACDFPRARVAHNNPRWLFTRVLELELELELARTLFCCSVHALDARACARVPVFA